MRFHKLPVSDPTVLVPPFKPWHAYVYPVPDFVLTLAGVEGSYCDLADAHGSALQRLRLSLAWATQPVDAMRVRHEVS